MNTCMYRCIACPSNTHYILGLTKTTMAASRFETVGENVQFVHIYTYVYKYLFTFVCNDNMSSSLLLLVSLCVENEMWSLLWSVKQVYNGLPDFMTQVAHQELQDLPPGIQQCSVIYLPQVSALAIIQTSSTTPTCMFPILCVDSSVGFLVQSILTLISILPQSYWANPELV